MNNLSTMYKSQGLQWSETSRQHQQQQRHFSSYSHVIHANSFVIQNKLTRITLKNKVGFEYHLVAKADTQDGYISTLQKYAQTYT